MSVEELRRRVIGPDDAEIAALQALADGYTVAQAARTLGLRGNTLSMRLRRLDDRLGLGTTTTGLVVHAVREGWIR